MNLQAIHQQTEEELKVKYGGRYGAYLKTEHWKITRAYMSKKYDGKCEVCGSDNKINIHHLTYERMGAETEDDLMCLCESCHKAVHSKMIFERMGTRKEIVRGYKKFKKIRKKFDNSMYMNCLPLCGKGWEVYQLCQLWCVSEKEAMERIESYVKFGLVNKQTPKGSDSFYVVYSSIFMWLSYEFPKFIKEVV